MKVLWITNILFPEAEGLLTNQACRESGGGGGWMLGAANALSSSSDIELSVATVSPLVSDLAVLHGQKTTYYVIPFGKGNLLYNKDYEHYWKRVKNLACPDVVHIHGTEYSHGLAYVKSCGSDKVVVSIQGMKSDYYYYCAGISHCTFLRHLTFRDFIKGTPVADQRRFRRDGMLEIKQIGLVKHVIGRTTWDKDHCRAINPEIKYHFCNETLRSEFYTGAKWNYDSCKKHSIFLSQVYYPLKGFHKLLEAMPLVLRWYPDATVRTTGDNMFSYKGLSRIIHRTSYFSYLESLIKKYSLTDKIVFCGRKNAEGMVQEYLNANVFVCPSSIENSPNSLGEAQILGTPCVASYVGGVPDMMKGDEAHLYRFDDVQMLAARIVDVFDSGAEQTDMRETALQRHNPEVNARRLIEIYNEIAVCG